MRILRYKKKAGSKYSLFLEDGREFVLYEDVILMYGLLISKEVSDDLLVEIYQKNLEYDVYYAALKSIQSRMKSTNELKLSLKKKDYPDNFIDSALLKLEKQGYLNDAAFTRSYIHSQMVSTDHGPGRIIRDLLSKGISSSLVEKEMVLYDEATQFEKIHKIIRRSLQNNRSRGGFPLKQKIQSDLILQGFYKEAIDLALSEYSFSPDPKLAKREYDKLYKKYSRKYSGYELDRVVREKMYQKGLIYEEY